MSAVAAQWRGRWQSLPPGATVDILGQMAELTAEIICRSRQARQAAKADRIRNRDIPAGSLIVVVPWLLHRHRQLWERPDAFEPERWMPGGSGAPSRYAYVPFSIGPRICTGAAFGLTEAVICLATLAASFRARLAPGATVQPVCRLTLRPGDSLRMLLERRGVGQSEGAAA